MKSKRIQTTQLLMMQSFTNTTQHNRAESTDPPGWAALGCSTRMNRRSSPRHGPKKSATSISTPLHLLPPATGILLHLREDSQKPPFPDIPSERHATVRRTASASFSRAPRILGGAPCVSPVCWTASRVSTAADMGLGQKDQWKVPRLEYIPTLN